MIECDGSQDINVLSIAGCRLPVRAAATVDGLLFRRGMSAGAVPVERAEAGCDDRSERAEFISVSVIDPLRHGQVLSTHGECFPANRETTCVIFPMQMQMYPRMNDAANNTDHATKLKLEDLLLNVLTIAAAFRSGHCNCVECPNKPWMAMLLHVNTVSCC